MTDNFPDRSNRLKSILSNANQTVDLPLFHEVGIPERLFSSLQESCTNYMLSSLRSANPTKQYKFCENILEEYEQDIISLPNKTPNGLVLPKAEILSWYNCLHQSVAKIMSHFELDEHVASIHAPVNVRLVSGKPSTTDVRPRASCKLHSDIWAGEFSNTVMLFLTALGDIEGNGIEFLEPDRKFLDYCHPLNDYLEGAELEKDSIKYDCGLKSGFAYFTDPFLLHRTVKKTPKLRLSIDFRFTTNIKCETDIEVNTDRHENYISLKDWYEIGTKTFLYTEATVAEAREDTTAASKNAYAAEYSRK
jgi:hypothetical protein